MPKQPTDRHRRSVALVPKAKDYVDTIAATNGVSANRAIEQAVEFYSKCLNIQKGRQLVALTMMDSQGKEEKVTVLV